MNKGIRSSLPLKLFAALSVFSILFAGLPTLAQENPPEDLVDRTLPGEISQPIEILAEPVVTAGIEPDLVDNALPLAEAETLLLPEPEPEDLTSPETEPLNEEPPEAEETGELIDRSLPENRLESDSGVNDPAVENALPGDTGLLDDFNWSNGPLSPAWKVVSGTFSVSSGRAQGHGTLGAFALHREIGSNLIEIDVAINPAQDAQYAGVVLNYGAGVDNIFVKVEAESGTGEFTRAACLKGSGAEFGLGAFPLDSPFTTAHLSVSVDADRDVTINISRIDGGSSTQAYVCSGAPAAEGWQVGFAAWNNAYIDNPAVGLAEPQLSDNFNRQDGPLGPNWIERAGALTLAGSRAAAPAAAHSVATIIGTGGSVAAADIAANPAGGDIQAAGLVLNYNSLSDAVFVKLQDNNNDEDRKFNTFFCYRGLPGFGALVGSGTLPNPITSARMQVTAENRRITIHLSNIDGGTGTRDLVCSGWGLSDQHVVGINSINGGTVDNFNIFDFSLDDFNRTGSSLGTGWATAAGSFSLNGGRATGGTGDAPALAAFRSPGSNVVEADIAVNPSVSSGKQQFAALVLNYGAGSGNLFIKVQDNNGDRVFDTAGCYTGNNQGPGFGLRFFELKAGFTSAHLRVTADAYRRVTLQLTEIVQGASKLPPQAYVCTGAPPASGNAVGIGIFNQSFIDNFQVTNGFTADAFNRSRGSLGPGWTVRNNAWNIVNGAAEGKVNDQSSLATMNGGTGTSVEGVISIKPGVRDVQFGGFVLNYGAGVTNLFIKIQDNDGNGTFDLGACYTGNNNPQWGSGVSNRIFALSAPFRSAHVKISVDETREVVIILTRIDGGSGSQVYTCAGAPPPEGPGIGIASRNGTRIDLLPPPVDYFYLPVVSQ